MNNQLIEKTPPKMMNWKVLLTILTLAATLMSSSYTMLIPFLPVYLTKELGVTEHVNLWSGAVFSVTFLVSTFMAPIWGAMSDKGSRKLMAIRSAVLLSLAYTLGGLVQTPTQLFFVRVLQGIAAGLWPALLAIMSSNCPQQKLGISMGIMQGAVTAGGVIGPDRRCSCSVFRYAHVFLFRRRGAFHDNNGHHSFREGSAEKGGPESGKG